MHDVVFLHRCYPSTPHGIGPWLPALPSAPQPELPPAVTLHRLPTDPTAVYDATGQAQRDELARFCDVCGFTWPPDEACPFH